jgi:large repetitive protein
LTCPESVTIPVAPGQNYADVTIPLPEASDNCGPVTLLNDFTHTANASGRYPIGTTIVTYTATDHCGLKTTCSFTVKVIDDYPPEIFCPPTIEVSCFQ